jgi:glycosyltransferase involved in cell wall biosynthesis
MRVLVVSQYFYPENFRINEVVHNLVDKGVAVEVLTGKPNYPEGTFFPSYSAWGNQTELLFGAKVYRIPIVARGSRSALWLALNYLSFILSGLLLAPWLLWGKKYDAVLVYGVSPIMQALPALLIGWIKNTPVILWVQDLWPESLQATGYVRNRWVLAAVRHVVKFIYRHANLLLVQSKGFEAPVSALAPGKQVVYFPNSVDGIFSDPPDVPLPEVSALDSGFPVVFAGNVGVGQAVQVIVEAATLLKDQPDIRFVVFGYGSRWDWMCEQVKARGLTNLHLPGRFPIQTMPSLMQKAAVLLVSLADEAIFAATVPNKVQAYMASGRPIIASINGEGARLIKDARAGLTCPAGDANALAAAVLKIFQMTSLERSILGRNGWNYFNEHFDHNMLTDQLISHITMVAENYGSKK